eukprot:8863600-Pyramimonas_sp.AAC.2
MVRSPTARPGTPPRFTMFVCPPENQTPSSPTCNAWALRALQGKTDSLGCKLTYQGLKGQYTAPGIYSEESHKLVAMVQVSALGDNSPVWTPSPTAGVL